MKPEEINKAGDVFKFLGEQQIKLQKDSVNIEDECDLCSTRCDSHGYYTCNCYSPCCGVEMRPDSDICPECHEHCI